MTTLRHILGLALAILLGAALYGAWVYYADFTRWEPLRPYRGLLTEWRLPILAVGGFMVLTLAEWVYSKTLPKDDHD